MWKWLLVVAACAPATPPARHPEVAEQPRVDPARAKAIECGKTYSDFYAMPGDCVDAVNSSDYPYWYKRELALKAVAETEAALRGDQPALVNAIASLTYASLYESAADWPDVLGAEDMAIIAHLRDLERQLIEAELQKAADAPPCAMPAILDHDLKGYQAKINVLKFQRDERCRQERDASAHAEVVAQAQAQKAADARAAADAAKKRAEAADRLHALLETKKPVLADLVAAAADAGLQLEIKDRVLAEFDARLAKDDFDGASAIFGWLLDEERHDFLAHWHTAMRKPLARVAEAMKTEADGHPALTALVHAWFDRNEIHDITIPAMTDEGRAWIDFTGRRGIGFVDSCNVPELKGGGGLTVRGVQCYMKAEQLSSAGSTTTSTGTMTIRGGFDQGYASRDVQVTTTTITPGGRYEGLKHHVYDVPSTIYAVLPGELLPVQMIAKIQPYDTNAILATIAKPVMDAVVAHARELAERAAAASDPAEAADLYARAMMLTNRKDAWGNASAFLHAHFKLADSISIEP